MDCTAPLELGELLHAPDEVRREAAWDELISRHTRLILAAARSLGGGYDEAMERYAYVLEKLRERDFHRLRAFRVDGRARFSTWLTVASRRLSVDHYRLAHGRSRSTNSADRAATQNVVRRRLADAIGSEVDADLLPDERNELADAATIRADRDSVLAAQVAELPARDRLLLALRFDDDLSAARIAGLLDLPTPFHVYRRLHSVLAELRLKLESQGMDASDG